MKKIEWALALFVAAGFLVMANAPALRAACAGSDVQCFTVGGSQVYKLDSSGNETVAGDVSIGDDLVVTDDANVTDALVVGGALSVTGASTHTGAVTQSTTSFTGGFAPYARTLAQMNALTATTTGQVIFVSDALQSRLCVSSGSVNAGSWVVSAASSPFTLATMPHCQ